MDRAADLLPVEVGLKVTLTLAETPGDSVSEEALSLTIENWLASVPVMDRVPISRSVVPALLTVSTPGALEEPDWMEPKLTESGVTEISG